MQSVLKKKRNKEEATETEIKLLKDKVVFQFYSCGMLIHLLPASVRLTGTRTDKHTFTLGQFRVDSSPNVHVGQLWEEETLTDTGTACKLDQRN